MQFTNTKSQLNGAVGQVPEKHIQQFRGVMLENGFDCREEIIADGEVYKFTNALLGESDCWHRFCNTHFSYGNPRMDPKDWYLPDDCLIAKDVCEIEERGSGEIPRSFNDDEGYLDFAWPDPLPIRNELLPLEPLPLDIIPEPYQAWIKDIAYRMQCAMEYVAVPAIIMTGSLIGARCGIRPKEKDNWSIIPNLWGGIIGSPSSLKTPSLAAALEPLINLEKKAREQFEAEQNDYAFGLEAHKIAKEAKTSQIKHEIKVQNSSPISINNIKKELKAIEEPISPTWQRFRTNDSTIEKMTELLAENPGGLLLFRDELSGLLASWDKEGREGDRAFYLEAWNGNGSHITDRIKRGTTHCNNMCVSVLGGTQPSKIIGYLRKAIRGTDNDGFVQRLQLMVYPDEKSNWQLVDKAPDIEARDRVFKIVEIIASIDFPQIGALQEDVDAIPYFHFTKEAQELFNEWLTELETVKLRGGEEPIIVEHLAKYRKLMPALALIFHVIDMAEGIETGQVSLHAAEKAAAWCDILELHARRIYGMANDSALQAASILSMKLKKHDLKDGFTARDLYRKGWSLLNNNEDAQAACDELVEAGWLREVVTEPAYQQKSKIEYQINPKIWRKS